MNVPRHHCSDRDCSYLGQPSATSCRCHKSDDQMLRESHATLLKALHEGRRAIGDHFAPNDCYATGPVTGDAFRDLVQCPACSFIAMYDAAIAKAETQS